MTSFAFNYRLGILSAIYEIRLKVTVIFTYITVSSIPLFNELPCPEATFFLRRSRDPERRCRMSSVIIKGPDMILSD